MSWEVKTVFSSGLIVSFRSARRISSYLLWTKLYSLGITVGSGQWGKCRCKVCTNVTVTEAFSNTVAGETFQINHELNWDDYYVLYLLKHKVCKKNFVEETTDAFRHRWINYKDSDRKFQKNGSCMQ